MPLQILRLRLRRSLMMVAFLVVIHTVAGLSLMYLTLMLEFKVVLGAVVLLSLLRCSAIHGLLTSPRSVVELTVHRAGMVTLLFQSGEFWEGCLRPDTYIHPLVVLMRADSAVGDTYSIMILRSQVHEEQFRRLRSDFLTPLRESTLHGL